MLSYCHAFHAGNHADILKHETLFLILEYLKLKDKPFTVFDTHAGAGRYLLNDERLIKTGEAASGIQRLLSAGNTSVPQELSDYIHFCMAYAKNGYYPGSPDIERFLLRQSDNLVLCELHPAEIELLRENMRITSILPQTAVKPQIHFRNGFEALKALTPPKIKRGLAFSDPSYEDISDYTETEETFGAVHKKWPTGILVLWYPLLNYRYDEIRTMKHKIAIAAKSGKTPSETLDIQLLINTPQSHTEVPLAQAEGATVPRLYGSGMLIVNPPWKLETQIKTVLPYLSEILGSRKNSSYSVQYL